MTTFGIDYAWGGPPSIAALKSASVEFVCRYLSHSPSKNLTLSEAKTLSGAGISLVVVWETTATRAEDGHAAGVSDAQDALAQAQACGMPNGRPIYFAVDEDTTVGPRVTAYFQGVASVLGLDRTGAYGGYKVVKGLFDAGLIRWGWQTYAWSGGQWDSRAHIQQYSNSHLVGGVDSDYDRATKSDFGQWRVGQSPTPTPQEDDMAAVTSVGSSGGQQIAAKTTAAIKFTNTYSDIHKFCKGDRIAVDAPYQAMCSAIVELHGFQPGDEITLEWTRLKSDGKTVLDDAWALPFYANKAGVVRAELGGQLGVYPSDPFQLRVRNDNAYPVTVQGVLAKISLFKTA